jgi:hypothetical protein
MNTLHILDAHREMAILSTLLEFGSPDVAVVPEMLLGEVIYAAQQDGVMRTGNLSGVIIVRENLEQSVFMDMVHEFVLEASRVLARQLFYNHISGYIVNWMLMPNGRDLILEERIKNGRIRSQGGTYRRPH